MQKGKMGGFGFRAGACCLILHICHVRQAKTGTKLHMHIQLQSTIFYVIHLDLGKKISFCYNRFAISLIVNEKA